MAPTSIRFPQRDEVSWFGLRLRSLDTDSAPEAQSDCAAFRASSQLLGARYKAGASKISMERMKTTDMVGTA